MCRHHPLALSVVGPAGRVEPTPERYSVLVHMFRIMRYPLDLRDHGHTGCVRALYGHWNDAMDGRGVSMDPSQTYGTGVSVMPRSTSCRTAGR